MDTINKKQTAGQKKHYGPRLVGEILQDYLKNSNESLARAHRDRLFKTLFPNTEVGIDLKLLTRQSGRLPKGKILDGIIVRKGADFYMFLENEHDKESVTVARRNPIVFEGGCINVHRLSDGTLRLAFCRPRFYRDFTFRDFCLAASRELKTIARLLGEEDARS